MELKQNDFLERLAEVLNSFSLPVYVGINDNAESIAIIFTGGGLVKPYFDGTAEAQIPIAIHVKSKSQQKSINVTYSIINMINQLNQLESDNGSFEFIASSADPSPMFMGMTERGEVVYSINTQFKIEGMINNGKI